MGSLPRSVADVATWQRLDPKRSSRWPAFATAASFEARALKASVPEARLYRSSRRDGHVDALFLAGEEGDWGRR